MPPRRSRWLRAVAGVVGIVLTVLVIPQVGQARADVGAPMFAEDVLFHSGALGYSCFRIPTIVKTNDGTLLAFAEGRIRNCADTGDIDLVLKRSTDGGQTWGPLQIVAKGNGTTRGNPLPIVDQRSGRVVLLSSQNPGDSFTPRHPFLQHSEDDGATWSAPKDVTDQISRPEWAYWYATGPVHGIQLQRGPYAGRMVASVYFSAAGNTPRGGGLVYSDDGGLNWHLGALDDRADNPQDPTCPEPGCPVGGEAPLVELTDGRIYASAREGDNLPGHRAAAWSSDGGETFDAPYATQPALVTPLIEASLLRLRAKDEGDTRDRILFSAPAHPAAREVMTIRSSYDEAESWDTWNQGKVIYWGPTAYSDLVKVNDDLIGLMYEAGTASPNETIRFARFNEAYLATPNGTPPGIPGRPAPGPMTPDRSRPSNQAYMRGEAQLVEGRFGAALNFDGVDDGVELPLSKSLDLGADDFTIATWFKYGDTAGNHALLWAYRTGPGTTPQIWLRAEPASSRIRALIGTGFGTTAVASTSAYNDGAWHHVALQRAGGHLSLWIDGALITSVAAKVGSVTEGQEFGVQGVYVGQRVDGVDRFHGAMDDVQIYRRALTPEEIERLTTSHAPASEELELWLPFDQLSRGRSPAALIIAGAVQHDERSPCFRQQR